MSGAVQPLLSYGGSTTPPSWAQVDAGIFSGDSIAGLAILDAANAVVVSAGGNAGWTSDGGNTWTHVANPLGAGKVFFECAGGNGIVCARWAPIADPAIQLACSLDNGATWTDVTPVGSDPTGSQISFVSGPGLFLFFDGDGDRSWVSSDGVTWIDTPLPPIGFLEGFGYPSILEQGGSIYVAGIGTGAFQYILSSVDAQTWTVVDTVTPQESFFCFGYDGTVLNLIYGGGGLNSNRTSSDGITWTARVTGTPPWLIGQIGFGSKLFTCGNGTGTDTEISISSDHGLSWATTVTIVGYDFINGFVAVGADLLAWGRGVAGSYDAGTTWAAELSLTTGSLNACLSASALTLAAGTDDSGNGGIWKRT